jgi:hypothetical protein
MYLDSDIHFILLDHAERVAERERRDTAEVVDDHCVAPLAPPVEPGPGAVRLAVLRGRRQDLRPTARHDLGLPGHGSDTTLGAERPHPAEWR